MAIEQKIRVLLAKPGLDGHDRGIILVARGLRDMGMEIIYLGLFTTPEEIVQASEQEDVDIIGLSFLSGSHMVLVPKIMELLRVRGLGDIPVVVGGVIPKRDIAELKKLGVAKVFTQGTSIETIADSVRDAISQRRRMASL